MIVSNWAAAASELNDYPHFKENPYNIILISIANYRKQVLVKLLICLLSFLETD